MIRLAVLAPGLALRLGLRTLLDAEPDLEVLAEAPSLEELPDSPGTIDVIVAAGEAIDLASPAHPLLESASPPALLLLLDELPSLRLLQSLPVPAWGVLPLDASLEELRAAVTALYQGLAVLPPEWLAAFQSASLVDLGETDLDDLVEALTDREQEVLQLLALGLANKQIAAALKISAHTVKFHISAIYAKLGAASRTEAVRLGLQRGLVSI